MPAISSFRITCKQVLQLMCLGCGVVLASCAVADSIPRGIDASAKELLPIRETLKLKILFILQILLIIRRAAGMARVDLMFVYTFRP